MTPAPAVHVVDDDPSMRKSLARLLEGAGYAVTLYSSAEDYLAAFDPAATGCLLLDLRLPGMGGLELQERLATRGSGIPIVFLTGHGDVAAGVLAMKRGAGDFLEKPVIAEKLFEALSTVMARAEAVRRQTSELQSLKERAATLSRRQREVWLRVVRGELNKQIAGDLGIVERTVKLHRAKAMEKLQAGSAADLVRIAERLGINRPD